VTNGILVVDRLGFFRRLARRDRVDAGCVALGLTGEETFTRYRGFDGDAWPSLGTNSFVRDDGLASPSDWPSVRQYMIGKNECEAIALTDVDGEIPVRGWVRLGIDIGYFHSQWSHYSVILNEVLFGMQAELRNFAGQLNANLLFETKDQCRSALTERNDLASRGADIESEDVGPITIFVPAG
jgi:hypothetical protein